MENKYEVYMANKPNKILYKGSKTNCVLFIKKCYGLRYHKNGSIRIAKLIFEHNDKA